MAWIKVNTKEKAIIGVLFVLIIVFIALIGSFGASIEEYPDKFDEVQVELDALALVTADLEKLKQANETKYEKVKNDTIGFVDEIFNKSTGFDAMLNIYANNLELWTEEDESFL